LKKNRIIIDTSFLLPILGIEVEEINSSYITLLREVSEKAELLYPSPMIIELLGKSLKKARELGFKGLPIEAIKGLEIILSGVFIKIISPDIRALTLASKIWLEGHRDLLDNIAYACSQSLNALFLTMDEELITFLKQNNYPINNIVDLARLRKLLIG